MAKITTIIDIGSNSTRMAIFKKTSSLGFYLLYEVKSKVRVSENSYENDSYLQKESINRCVNSLKEFKKISDLYRSKKLICVATSAVRDAPNRLEFTKKVRQECDINIKIIDGKKEAFYGALACANLLHKKDGVTIDIGGGSTEMAIIKNGKILNLISLDLGSIRMKELFFDKDDVQGATNYIKAYLDNNAKDFIDAIKEYGIDNIFGIGGSIRAFANYMMIKDSYNFDFIHGYEIEVAHIIDELDKITNAKLQDLKLYGFKDDRIDSIRGGLLILKIILEEINVGHLVISGAGIREGVFLSDLLRHCNHTFPKGFNPSLKSLQDSISNDIIAKKSNSRIVTKAINVLFEQVKNTYINLDSKMLYYLQVASKIYNVGNKINFYESNEHSSYIALNALIYGFSHKDRLIISILLKYSHKRRPQKDLLLKDGINMNLMPLDSLKILSFILAIAIGLDNESDFCIASSNKTITLKLHSSITRQYLARLQLPLDDDNNELLGLKLI